MEISDIKIADFCEDETTVEIEVKGNGLEQVFYVQTVDGEYRPDLGCWIMTPDESGDIGDEYYEAFDIDSVISAAEGFIFDKQEEVATDEFVNGSRVHLIDDRRVIKNPRYINKDTSSYQRKWIDVPQDQEQESGTLDM